MPKEIAFITLANPDVGFGHLNRCLLLARALSCAGAKVKVFLLPPYEGVDAFLKSVNWPQPVYRTKTFPESVTATACILDLFCLQQEILDGAKVKCRRILLFDDGKHTQIPDSVDGIINANAGIDNNYPSKCKVFAGLNYCLIRLEFFEHSWQSAGSYIFICMGGSDPEEQTIRVARLCAQWLPGRHILVVEGPGFRRQDDSLWKSIPNLTVVTDPQNLVELMSRAVFAISGGGTMLYELVALGVPVACLALDEAQDRVASTLSNIDSVGRLGRFNEINDEELGRRLRAFAAIFSTQKFDRTEPANPFDGKGDVRLARDLLQWLETTASME